MLAQIIIHDQNILALIHKVFGKRRCRVRRNILKRRRIRRAGADHNSVIHSAALFQRIHQFGNGGCFLADGVIYANTIFAFLVQYGIQCNRGFTGLAVTDDQLTLTSADREHGIDSQNTRFKRF